MNEVTIATVFFMVLFAGSLFYSVKSKKRSLASYLLNLEIEYALIGAAIFLIAAYSTKSVASIIYLIKPILYVLLTFMGLVIGTNFSMKLLKTLPKGLIAYTLTVYITGLVLLYGALWAYGIDKPIIYAIALNSMMPYSINLTTKLFRLDREKAFISRLVASLFPFLVLFGYTAAAGFHDYRPKDFGLTVLMALVFTFVFSHYGRTNEKKTINLVSIIFVICLAGAAMYTSISPIVAGFLVGFFLSDTKYGGAFHTLTMTFERFLYLFFYVAIGIFLAYSGAPGPRELVLAGGIIALLVFVRCINAKTIYMRLLPTKEDITGLLPIGILPAVIIIDYGTRAGFAEVAPFFPVFFTIHLATEIITYLRIKYETKAV
ncbi:hypothetical protein [Limisalsivibrio acetivorans]|uniref:hypothetical protein n=1 Tax=Limisalsivibrio acetivorans TaxID=1304888 RepID=UPI0003B3793F|nr:hypothetical protein [Limisalsivibrio acetivorans]